MLVEFIIIYRHKTLTKSLRYFAYTFSPCRYLSSSLRFVLHFTAKKIVYANKKCIINYNINYTFYFHQNSDFCGFLFLLKIIVIYQFKVLTYIHYTYTKL